MTLLLLLNQQGAEPPAPQPEQSSGAAPSQALRPWPRAAVRVALMAEGHGHGIARGSVVAEVHYPNGSRSPGAPRASWLLPTGGVGRGHASATVRASCLQSVRATGTATATGKASATVWQDDAAELLALVAALDLAHMECAP